MRSSAVRGHPSDFNENLINNRLVAAVDAKFQVSTFRTSLCLKDALKSIVENQVVPHLNDFCSQASFNIRVGALMKLSVSFLCMPRLSSLLGFGLVPTLDEGYEISKRLKACVSEMLLILILVESYQLNGGEIFSAAIVHLLLWSLIFYLFTNF